MTTHQKLTMAFRTAARSAVALLVIAPPISALTATAAQAHGAPQNPISRAVACGPEGGQYLRTAACRAAIAAGDGLTDWDNIRVANVAGRDRQRIPDGKLCSAGIDRHLGLDLPRGDWPATNLTSGDEYTFTYRETIAHQGVFRMYVTRDSYDATQPLSWADLETAPFLTATDPPEQGRAYVMKARLPAGKSGRHLIYTIWQNTSTPDTYYSCSDVVFSVPGQPPTRAGSRVTAAAPATADAAGYSPSLIAQPQPVASDASGGRSPLLLAGILVALILTVAVAVVGAALRRRQRRRW
jgi:predicted carbohydrate-binding protein with CBM5 and CBM33 domain